MHCHDGIDLLCRNSWHQPPVLMACTALHRPVLPCTALYYSALLYCSYCLVLPQARHRNPKTPELWLAAIRTEQRAGSTKAAEALLAKGLQVCMCVLGGGLCLFFLLRVWFGIKPAYI
jgi:hypothetical protein